jgi:hypothetical protein
VLAHHRHRWARTLCIDERAITRDLTAPLRMDLALFVHRAAFERVKVFAGAAQESDIPNFKGSSLGRFPLVSANSWTSDHLSERSRRANAFPGTRARGTLTLKRR